VLLQFRLERIYAWTMSDKMAQTMQWDGDGYDGLQRVISGDSFKYKDISAGCSSCKLEEVSMYTEA
jgi:hypothetical protein